MDEDLEGIIGDIRSLPPSSKKARLVAYLRENCEEAQQDQRMQAAPTGPAIPLGNQFDALAATDHMEDEEAARQRTADDASKVLALAAGTPLVD